MNIKATVITRHNPSGEYIEPVSKNEFKSLQDSITPASGTLNADGTVSWSGSVAMPITMDTADTSGEYIYDIKHGPARTQVGRVCDPLSTASNKWTLKIPAGSSYADFGITFNSEFLVAPYLYLTARSTTDKLSNAITPMVNGATTTTGATVRVWRNDEDTSSDATFQLYWMAIGRSGTSSGSDPAKNYVTKGDVDTAVAAEKTAREAADTALQSAVNAKATAASVTAEATARAAADEALKSDIGRLQYNEPLVWELKNGISSTGVVGANNYTALSQLLTVSSGDVYKYTGPIRDSANNIFSIYLHFYTDGAWQSRVNVNINKDPITVPDNINGVRITFGRTSSSGVQISNADIETYYSGGFSSFAQVVQGVKKALHPHEYTVATAVELYQLFKDLADDDHEKVIYLQGGEYDAYAAYRSLNVPVPPAGTSTSNYFNYNIFVPLNTALVGRGDVVIKWLPTSDDVTAIESQIYCPINVVGSIKMENITVNVKNGRYCIHDDGHNENADTVHEYKNVTCVFEAPDTGYTLTNTIGFGFDPRGRYIFDGCTFENKSTGVNHSAFYGHGSTASSQNPSKDSASIVVKNCVLKSIGANTVRLQTITTVREHIKTMFENCYISRNVLLTQLSSVSGATNPFDLTLLKCGTPTVTVTDTTNPYEVKTYA